MSNISQLTTFADLYTDLQNRVRVTTGVAATETQAKRYINIALQDMHLGFEYRFPWAERQARLVTQKRYSAGRVAIAQGAVVLTGIGTAWNALNPFAFANVRPGGKMLIAGGRTPYVVQVVASATSLTLTHPFTEPDAPDADYVYYEDEYALVSDFLRPVDAQKFSEQVSIDIISRTEFRRRYPTNATPGRPSVATIVDASFVGNTVPVRHVRLAPPPADFVTIPYSYITANLATDSLGVGQTGLVANTDEPIVPLRYRHALVLHSLYHWYRDKKDDQRSIEAKGEYTDLMLRMASDVEVGAPRPQFRPRISRYKRAAQAPYRGGGGRYDTNGRFDRMED